MPSTPTIVEFVTDPQLLGLSISPAQETLLRAIYGLDLNADQQDIFRRCTGRSGYPGHQFSEATVIAGARSGKDSRIAAPIVVYESVFGQHEAHLSRGERGVIPLVAQDARAAKIAYSYIRAYLTRSPLLAPLIADEPLASEITLTNGLSIMCFPSTQRSLRGWSIPVGVMDELAFYRLEGSADSDVEIQASIRRGMISFPQTRLVKVSTPYMRSGVLYSDHKTYFGTDTDDVLVWVAETSLMNPTITAERLARERRVMDSARYRREFEAVFAEDVAAFLPQDWVERAVETGVREREFVSGVRHVAGCDPSGGGPDSMTLAVVHPEGTGGSRRVIVDVLKGWGRHTEREAVVSEAASILKRYGLSRVVGDRYAAAWVREAFRRHGISYTDAQITKDGEPTYLDRSSAYLECEPLFASGLISLLDHPAMVREFINLERRPSQGGRDRVDHPRGTHDDHANAVALAAAIAARSGVKPVAFAPLPQGVHALGEPSGTVGQVGHLRGAGPRAGVGGQAAKLGRYYR